MDGAEPVRRFRDVIAPPDDWPHTRGSECICSPSVEVGGPSGDVVIHRRREGGPITPGQRYIVGESGPERFVAAGDPVEQGESDL